jgi:hypothetical protein
MERFYSLPAGAGPTTVLEAESLYDLRRRRDSNPGGSSTPPNRLAGGSFRPLRHVSVDECT